MTILPSTPDREQIVNTSSIEAWKPTLVAIGAAILVFAAGFHDEAIVAIRTWLETTAYNYCFLVLPVVGYLLWERRSAIQACRPRTMLWPLLAIPVLSALWLVAAALQIYEARQLLMMAMFEAVLLVALGWAAYRSLLAPLLFLFFLVPTGAFLIPSLQSITADITVAGLHLLHIPVFSDGYLIDIPEGSFEIAEACAGLRFLISAGVFSCLFAVVMYRSWLRRGFYIALSLATAVVANGVRAFGILLLAHLSGSAAAVEADHIIYGWLFFSLVIALLIGIGMLFAETDERPVPGGPVIQAPIESPAPRWHVLAIPLAAVLALSGPAYATWLNTVALYRPLPETASPAVAAPWRLQKDQAVGWHPVVKGADREMLESFDGPDLASVSRYVALYRLRATGSQLTRYDNHVADDTLWRIARSGQAELKLRGQRLAVTSTEIVNKLHRRLVWSFYIVDNRIAGGLLEAKLLQLRAVLRHQSPLGAFVAVSASMDDTENPAAQQLAQFLAASESLPGYIGALQRQVGREPAQAAAGNSTR